jgi:enoyl-CoA hydratase
MSEFLRYEVDGLVGTITIDRPEKRNAMTYAMLGDFISLVREAGADPATSVLVITGVPGAFCAGTDLADLATIPGETRGLRGSSSDHDVWWPIVQCPKPTICAIDGPAVGMGAEFTSQCDLRIASTNARFAWNFVHRGLVPDTGAGTWLLPRIVGLQNALRLTYTGQMIDADEALRLGYVLDVVAPDELPARVQHLSATHGIAVSAISVRAQRTRWGSCSPRGEISLNWRLVQVPEWVRDYVILHELAHRRHLNHSARFWQEVERLCPDYEAAEAWLRETGRHVL